MSTCPDQELFSIYIDGELPDMYREKLEDHLSRCSECRKKYDKLNSMHKILRDESDQILISEKSLEDSFVKLQAKKSYSNYRKHVMNRHDVFLRVLPAMAAALVIAIILPVRMMNSSAPNILTDTIKTFTTMPETFRRTGVATDNGLNVRAIAATPDTDSGLVQKATYASDLTSALQNQILTSIDIFGSEKNTKKIQITIDLSNVSGISGAEKEAMKLIPMTVSFPSEGQQ